MDRYEALKETLSRTCPDMILREQEPMWRHTTFEIGGPVRLMAVPADERELQMTLRAAHQHDIVPFILGNGSNLLCQDEPIDRFVVKTTGALTKLAVLPGDVVLCGAGVAMPQLAAFAMQNGLTGLEFLSGIPGTLGGGIMMNAGAYSGEVKDVLIESRYLTFDGQPGVRKGEDQELDYRHSYYKDKPLLITTGLLQLQKGDKREIMLRMNELKMRRMSKQPLDFPSAGSTFKRPAQGYAAALIDRCGLKGLTVGGAQVSTKHAGFIVNKGDATCADVLELVKRVQNAVRMGSGVELEMEVRRLP
jgi:UDP-N-acetylmuramate dehydrogenase